MTNHDRRGRRSPNSTRLASLAALSDIPDRSDWLPQGDRPGRFRLFEQDRIAGLEPKSLADGRGNRRLVLFCDAAFSQHGSDLRRNDYLAHDNAVLPRYNCFKQLAFSICRDARYRGPAVGAVLATQTLPVTEDNY